jgi:hypothetical protein
MPGPSGGARGGDPYNYYTDDPPVPPVAGGGGIPPGQLTGTPFGGAPVQPTFAQPGTLPYARRRRLAGRVQASSQPAYFGPSYGTQAPEYASMFGYGGESGMPVGQPPVSGPGVPRGAGRPSALPAGWPHEFGGMSTSDILGLIHGGGRGGAGREPIDALNPTAPSYFDYLKQFPGIGDLMNPAGSDTLYNSLYGQGISQAGAASRRALVGARARGLGGTPYGLLAQEAERESLGELARNLLGARSESIGRNQEFIGRMAGGYQDFLNSLYRERQQYLRERELEMMRQQFERGRRRGWNIGVGGVSVGG